MRKTLQIISWVTIVIGSLSILSSFSTEDFYEFVGGALFAGQGLIALLYIKQVDKEL